MRFAGDHAPAAQPPRRPAAEAAGGPAGPPVPTVYAGIGSRRTPRDVLELMRTIAAALAGRGWAPGAPPLRGAGQAFTAGPRAAGGAVEPYLPWSGFAGQSGAHLARPTRRRARDHGDTTRHGSDWTAGRSAARPRAHQALDASLDAPAALIVSWTADGSLDGHAAPRAEPGRRRASRTRAASG